MFGCYTFKPLQTPINYQAIHVKLTNDIYRWYKPLLIISLCCKVHGNMTSSYCVTRLRHQMETLFALLAICAGISPITCEFRTQRPVTRSFGVIFILRLTKRMSKQSWGWWSEMPSSLLWRHCNAMGQCWIILIMGQQFRSYSISQEICTRFCCALLCCGYAIVHNEFTWSIYPYSSGLLCWHWGNR